MSAINKIQYRDLPSNLNKIIVSGNINLIFATSNIANLSITAENQEDINSIETYIEENILHVLNKTSSTKVNNFQIGNINIDKITCKNFNNDFKKITVKIEMPFCPDFKVSGTSSINLYNINQQTINLNLSGSSTLNASGYVIDLNANTSGSSDLLAVALTAKSANLCSSGASDIKCTVIESLIVKASGSSDILINGNPLIKDQKISSCSTILFNK